MGSCPSVSRGARQGAAWAADGGLGAQCSREGVGVPAAIFPFCKQRQICDKSGAETVTSFSSDALASGNDN